MYTNQVRCICAHKYFKKIVNQFQALDDIFRQYKKITNPAQESNNNKYIAKFNKWDEKLCKHLQFNEEIFRQYFCFNRPKTDKYMRSNEKNTKSTFVTMWNYHPRLLNFQEYQYHRKNAGRKYKNIFQDLTLPVDVVKKLQLYSANGGELYYKSDTFGNEVFIVPNYNRHELIKDDIEKCVVAKSNKYEFNSAINYHLSSSVEGGSYSRSAATRNSVNSISSSSSFSGAAPNSSIVQLQTQLSTQTLSSSRSITSFDRS